MPNIDWEFIGELEGRSLTAYVPAVASSDSGATICTGVDLGRVKPSSLPTALQGRLSRLCGLIGNAARLSLDAESVSLTAAQCDILDNWAAQGIINPVIAQWNIYSKTLWESISDPLATVVVSVAYQYGRVWDRCPAFWQYATALDIPAVINELKHFGDVYPTRREREAAYLSSHIPSNEELLA